MAIKRRARLNNMQLGYQRNDLTYEAVMIDLYLMGVISKDVCEAFTGREVADNVRLPDAAKELEENDK